MATDEAVNDRGNSSEQPERIGPTSGQLFLVLGGLFLLLALSVGAIGGAVYYAVSKYQEKQAEIARKGKEIAEQQRLAAAEQAERRAEQTRLELEAQERLRVRMQEEMQRRLEAQVRGEAPPDAQPKPAQPMSPAKVIRPLTAREIESRMGTFAAALHPPNQRYTSESQLGPVISSVASKSYEGLSWRVHILPSLGLSNIYSQFHFDEPWDSEHNRTLLPKIPDIFRDPLAPEGQTCVLAVMSLDGPAQNRTMVGQVTDGLRQTIELVYLKPEASVPWTKPDFEYPLSTLDADKLAAVDGKTFVSFCSGNYAAINTLDQGILTGLLSPDGGEHIFEPDRGSANPSTPELQLVTAEREDRDASQESPASHFATLAKALKALVEDSQRPAEGITESGLSWRVHLLPYLGEQELYSKFRLNEPWNSQHNAALILQIPEVYQAQATRGRSRYRLLTLERMPVDRAGFPLPGTIKDDPATTLAIAMSAPHEATTWTEPDRQETITADSLKGSLGWSETANVPAATWDGAFIDLPSTLHASKTAALLSIDGQEHFDLKEALESPGAKIRFIAKIQPATPIPGKLELPPLPAGSAPTLMAGELFMPDPNLRQLSMAIHQYFDETRDTPATLRTTSGKPSGLSWRVHLLKTIGQKPLYDRFNIDEPWDSEHNKQLLDFMPEVFRAFPDQTNTTCYQILGSKHGLLGEPSMLFRSKDGLEQTMLIARVARSKEVFWTQPDPSPDLPHLSIAEYCDDSGVLPMSLGSGDQIFLSRHVPDEIFRAMVSHDGQELIDARSAARWAAQSLSKHSIGPVQQAQWDSARMKQLILGIQNYHDSFRQLPPGQGSNINPAARLRSQQLSWRVHILPFIGYQSLFAQFRLEEPWDSPHNSQLLSMMPDCFRAADDSVESHSTRILTFTGPGTLWPEPGESLTMQVPDGASNTIAFFQADAESAVPWTRPEDFELDLTSPNWRDQLSPLTRESGRPVAMLDGAIRRLRPEIKLESLRALITPDRSELVKPRDAFSE